MRTKKWAVISMRVPWVFCLGLAGILALCVPLAGQFTTASLGGNVGDLSGLPVPDATITVENLATGFKQITKSGPSGDYLFPSLPVGNYDLTVQKTGFTTYVQHGIVLTVNQAATQTVQLQVGAMVQEVTVSGSAPLVTTQSATVGQLVNQQNIVDLPLNGREVQQLVFLAPGTANVTSHYCAFACEGGVVPSEQYAKVNGAISNGVTYLLDGVDNNDTYINANLPFPNPDAVQEFNIQTNNMSAAYGNAIGAVVDVVTKSGTNQFHGDAFEFVRNGPLFDARNFFAPTSDALKQNQFGGSFGGPIKKDKLFFFTSYQGTRAHTAPQGQIAFVPTAAERTGDFSDLLPATQLMNPVTGVPYGGNQIPISELSPVSLYFLQHIPLPNGPGQQLTYIGGPSIQDDDQLLVRGDYYAGKHHLSGRYFFYNYNQPAFVPPPSNILEANPDAMPVRIQTVSINDIYTASPRLMFNTYFGYNQQNGYSLSDAPFSPAEAGVKIATTPIRGHGDQSEINLTVNGAFSIETSQFGEWDRGDQTFREVATFMKGSHELQFGAQALRIRAPMADENIENGAFSFSNDLTGDNVADFMVGQLSTFTQAGGLYLNFTGVDWSGFFQDDWRAMPRLTVSAGLRWDPFWPYTDSIGRVACFVPGAHSARYPNAPTDLIFGGSNHDPGCPPSSIYSNLSNLGPRVGFAYRLTQDGKTSVRGGAGYYYEPPNTVAFEDVVGIPPFAPIVNLTDVSFSNPYGSAGIADPFPADYGPRNPGPNATFPPDISFTQIFPRDYRLPQVLGWNLTFERQLAGSWLLRAAYLGNKGTYLSGTADQESALDNLNPAIYIPGVGPNGQPLSTEANTQQRRIYPNFGYIDTIVSAANSNYNALQLTTEKRFSHGLSFLADYTWSKAMDDFAPLGAFNTSDSFDREFDYGPSGDDLTNVINVSGIYQLPHAALGGVAGKLTNGWELTAVQSWNNGFPFTVFSGYDNSFSGNGADRADLTVPNVQAAVLSSGRPHGQDVSEWFNTSVFGPNAVGTFGNTGKNFLRGPGFFDADLALLKNTKLSERTSLQFRAEFFNALNSVNFGMPQNILTSSGFGQLTSTVGNPRILQFALKLFF